MIARLAFKQIGQQHVLVQRNASAFAQNLQGQLRTLGSIQRMGVENPNMSQAVVHNGIVYISGQVDATATDIEGQTADVLGKVDGLLQEAGTDKTKLLTASIWVKDIENDFQGMNSVWNKWIDANNKPVRATGETKKYPSTLHSSASILRYNSNLIFIAFYNMKFTDKLRQTWQHQRFSWKCKFLLH